MLGVAPESIDEGDSGAAPAAHSWLTKTVSFGERSGVDRCLNRHQFRKVSFDRKRALGHNYGLTIFTYAGEPGSRSDEELKLLGSWAATADPAATTGTIEPS